MKIIKKINGTTYQMKLEGLVIGIYAEELDRTIHSTDFVRLGINNLVFDFNQVNMIDSIALEAISHAQEQGLKVFILNPKESVKDLLERKILRGKLSPFLHIVEKDRRISAHQEVNIPLEFSLSC